MAARSARREETSSAAPASRMDKRTKMKRWRRFIIGINSSGTLLRKQFSDGVAQGGDHLLHLGGCCAIGRHQHDHIPYGPREHTALRHGFANAESGAFP